MTRISLSTLFKKVSLNAPSGYGFFRRKISQPQLWNQLQKNTKKTLSGALRKESHEEFSQKAGTYISEPPSFFDKLSSIFLDTFHSLKKSYIFYFSLAFNR
jgi:hypothetical protein